MAEEKGKPVSPFAPEPVYTEPPDEAIEAMRRHLRDEHDRGFQLRRDVEFLGHRPKRPILSFERSHKGSRYWCDRCPGRVFIVGPLPYGNPERNQILQLHDKELRSHLDHLPYKVWDAFTEAWDRGDVHRAMAEQAVGKAQQRTRRAFDPAAQRRREGAQTWMLDRRAEIGRVEEVLDELYEILEADRSQREEILGADRRLSRETLRRYWRDIPNTQRAASKQAFEALPEAERNARLAQRRSARVTR